MRETLEARQQGREQAGCSMQPQTGLPAVGRPLTQAAEQGLDSRDNVEDALTKMQKALDSAAKSVIPKAPNVAKKKKIDKQCAPAFSVSCALCASWSARLVCGHPEALHRGRDCSLTPLSGGTPRVP